MMFHIKVSLLILGAGIKMGWATGVMLPAGARIFLSSTASILSLCTPGTMGNRGSFAGGKAAGACS
jgi:hypothetical protein